MKNPASGTVLISDPFLKDPNFMRTVVLLCEHNAEGSFGFVLNRPFEQTLNDFIPELIGGKIPVYFGGPVQTDSLHFIHSLPGQIADGIKLAEGVYWGGNFQHVMELIRAGALDLSKIRFFLGYSGWGNGQLDEEITAKSWLIVAGNQRLVFMENAAQIWKEAIRELDEPFHEIINYPIDPQLN